MVIPDTVAFSYAGAFGLSILVWQHLIGLHLHWLVLPLTFIIRWRSGRTEVSPS